jgi:serine/threonine protein kinase
VEARPKQVDDYALGALLGAGLTGQTYLARRVGPDGHLRQVALKLCDPTRSVLLPWAARLMDEVDPRVVRYEAVGGRSKKHAGYWVTDLVRAEPLVAVVEGSSFARRLGAVAEVAEAIAALHAARLVHGHLLPQNVLLRRERTGALTPLVTDAGVRPCHDPAFHEAPEVAPRLYPFLAPEAAAALLAGSDTRESPADVYALGALLCALLSGCGPGLAEGERTSAEILRSKQRRTYFIAALVEPDPDSNDAVVVDLEGVNDLLQRSLAPRPDDRPSAGEFAQAARAALLRPEPALP